MKKLRFRAYVIVSFLVVLMIAVVSYLVFPKDLNNQEVNVNEDPVIHRKVFLISDDYFVVPVTISFEAKPSLAEELHFVTTLLKEGSPIIKEGFQGVLHEQTEIHSINVDNGILTLDLSADFEVYAPAKEVRILEALAWTYGQYPEIEGVKLKIDGTALQKMPVNQTVIPTILSKDFGINNHVFYQQYRAKPITFFYHKTIGTETFYVAVTKRLNFTVTNLSDLFVEMVAPVATSTTLKRLDVWNQLTLTSTPTVSEQGVLNLDIGVQALIDEGSMSVELYKLLALTLLDIDGINQMVVTVQGEAIQVDGYPQLDEVKVNSIVVNEVAI